MGWLRLNKTGTRVRKAAFYRVRLHCVLSSHPQTDSNLNQKENIFLSGKSSGVFSGAELSILFTPVSILFVALCLKNATELSFCADPGTRWLTKSLAEGLGVGASPRVSWSPQVKQTQNSAQKPGWNWSIASCSFSGLFDLRSEITSVREMQQKSHWRLFLGKNHLFYAESYDWLCLSLAPEYRTC